MYRPAAPLIPLIALATLLAACATGPKRPDKLGLKPARIEVRGLSLLPGAIGGRQPAADVILRLGIENPNRESLTVRKVFLKVDANVSGIILEKNTKALHVLIEGGSHLVVKAKFPARYVRGQVPSRLPPFSIRGNVVFESSKGQFVQSFTQAGPAED